MLTQSIFLSYFSFIYWIPFQHMRNEKIFHKASAILFKTDLTRKAGALVKYYMGLSIE